MHFSTLSGGALLLALVSQALATGSATVVNNCGFPIYYASVGQNYNDNFQELQGSYTEAFSQPGVGVSIKLSPNASGGPVSQFEFTWADGKVFYDLSNIDGSPFANDGMEVMPSMTGDPNNPSCQPVNCPAGQAVCGAAYNQPNDVRTTVCDQDANLVLTMCPGGSSKRSEPTQSPNLHRHHARHLPKRA